MIHVAILDDYQSCAKAMADWTDIETRAKIVTFTRSFPDENALVEAIGDFEVLCLMRERTPFPRTVLERLPNLKRIVLTGRRSQTLDIQYLGERGVSIDFTGMGPTSHATPELAIGLMFSLA